MGFLLRVLPNPSINPPPHFMVFWLDIVLGLDPENDGFKVVGIAELSNVDTCERYHLYVIAVYRSITNSWRCFEDVAMLNSNMQIFSSIRGNTCLNGVYYWMEYHLERKHSILAFDMDIEVLRQIEMPKCIQGKFPQLSLYNDSIALVSYELGNPLDTWLMKEEGRWTKILTIQQYVSEEHQLWRFWKANAIMGRYFSGQMIHLNFKTQEIRNLEPSCDRMFWLTNYKNSLASVKQGLQDQEGHYFSVAFHEFFGVPPKLEENEHLMFTADLPNYPLDPPKYWCTFYEEEEEEE